MSKQSLTRTILMQVKSKIKDRSEIHKAQNQFDQNWRDMKRALCTGILIKFQETLTACQQLAKKINPDKEFDYKQKFIDENQENNTILHIACTNNKYTMVQYLLKNGHIDEINKPNKKGFTCLQFCANYIAVHNLENMKLFDLLLDHGADILIQDSQGNDLIAIMKSVRPDCILIKNIQNLISIKRRVIALFIMQNYQEKQQQQQQQQQLQLPNNNNINKLPNFNKLPNNLKMGIINSL